MKNSYRKYLLLFTASFSLTACVTDELSLSNISMPKLWSVETPKDTVKIEDAKYLKSWWKRFNDPVLDTLVDKVLSDSPDRLIAEARVLEARGIRRTARSALFPQVGASASLTREDYDVQGSGLYPETLHDARFDASYELDIFGRNRRSFRAADEGLLALQEEYHDVSLTLIAEVMRSYIDFREAQLQKAIADKNLKAQEKTLSLIQELKRVGEAPLLDVERANNLVNSTRASIPEFNRAEKNARLRLSILTGELPEKLVDQLDNQASIPGAELLPVMVSPASVIAQRPDVRAAAHNFAEATDLKEAAVSNLFPSFSISSFYGVTDSVISGGTNIWSAAIGTAVSLIDFGRIEGQIDAASAREMQAYQLYRKTIIEAVVEVETALNDYSNISESQNSLQQAYISADKALELSQTLYKEGAVSFLDVLDAQRSANNAEAEYLRAKASQSESLVRLFKALGVY